MTDLTTSTVVDAQVPFTGVSFADSVSGGGGSFTGSCSVNYPAFSAWPSNDGLRRVVWPCRDGNPVGAYLLTGASVPDARATVIQWKGTRLDWILSQRVIVDTLTFTNVDQNHILRDLIRYAACQTALFSSPPVQQAGMLPQGAVPWLVLDAVTSGVARTRQETVGNTDDGYPASARKNVAQMIKNLTELDQGIEYRWLYRMNAGLPEMVLDTAGQRLLVGTPEDYQAKLTFDFPGGNIASASWGFDSTTIVTRSHVLGQKQDTTTPIGTATYTDLWALGYPLIDKVGSEGSVQSQGVLDGKAGGMLHAADDAWSITLDGNKRPRFGEYGLGDYVTLRILQAGRRRDRSMRITGWTVAVSDSGRTEKVTPTVEVGKWL